MQSEKTPFIFSAGSSLSVMPMQSYMRNELVLEIRHARWIDKVESEGLTAEQMDERIADACIAVLDRFGFSFRGQGHE